MIMTQLSISEMTNVAAGATEPSFVAATTPKFGGIDPLGLRQINFDLMDQVIPGLNNVARHIRPFVVVTWAWRRARQLAETQGFDEIPIDQLRDFVDRIEVIYAWSQFLRNPNADLPGRLVLAPLLRSDHWVFGGDAWQKRRKDRRYSTAFTAPITYGPSLKTFGWLAPHREHADVFIPAPASSGLESEIIAALNAFEAHITDRLNHPAFSKFGEVQVTAKNAKDWSDDWALDGVTKAEKHVMMEMLLGSAAPIKLRNGIALMRAAVSHASSDEVATIRRTMAGAPSNFVPPNELSSAFESWRRVQVRQLFRLSLEALLYWTAMQIENEPKPSQALVYAFINQVGRPDHVTAREWLDASRIAGRSPTVFMDEIIAALRDSSHAKLALAIADGLSFSIAEAPEQGQVFERSDRLPLFRARREANAWGKSPTKVFLQHVLESWVLAQHVYWSVGRGLADARARGKALLRLKIVLEEGGWTLTPGASRGSAPVPTPDRLQTALTLARECGLLGAAA
jgi:hypothetical protein